MPWPTPDEYSEALQCPELSFEDDDLRTGETVLTPLGLPRVASGNFACVYEVVNGNRSFAVKCFLRSVHDQHQRYAQISQFVMTTNLTPMVAFDYQLKGIFIEGQWYPIVKMDWVDGLTLDHFARKNWSNKAEIDRVIRQFRQVVQGLQEVGVAHCDLQHGNIMVIGDALKLVDYDGMFVPAMAGQSSNELGHGNFQHLQRTDKDFGPGLDNFSAWIIHYSLLLLKLDPAFWQRHAGGDDCLLFRKADFLRPQQSRLMKEIAEHQVPDIRALHEPIMKLLCTHIGEVPVFAYDGTISQIISVGNQLALFGDGATKKPDLPDSPIYPKIWPRAEQYFSSVIRPAKNFLDEKLVNSVPIPTAGRTTQGIEVDATTEERLTIATTIIKGSRHVVVRMAANDGSKQYAVKFFTHALADRHLRYDAIHRFKKQSSSRYFVPFVYQPKGVLVGDDWLPLLKMLWVSGSTLDDYVLEQLTTGFPEAVEELLPKFDNMIKALAADGISHGNLEPKNILVDESGNLRIIDYDAMYIPALANLTGCETGREEYQHPVRKLVHFGPYVDNFSAIQIYGMLRCFCSHAPQKSWNWQFLARQLSNPSGPESRPHTPNKKTSTWALDRSGDPGFKAAGRLDPIFEKASANEVPTGDSFEGAKQRLTKVLKEERMKRIDQVDTLSMVLWRLF
jgi:serine/threonine protein kinase